MECSASTEKRLRVETEKAIYLIQFGQIQIEITGRCNMKCRHCRASSEVKRDMPKEQIMKTIQFAREYSPDYKEIIVSGGEPLMHQDFFTVMKELKRNGGESITLTTNGSLISEEHLEFLEELQLRRCTLSVSLDSLISEEHDHFRRHPGSHKKALSALKLISERSIPGIVSSARMTLRPEQISKMEEMAKFVFDLGCDRVSFSSIHPSGEGKKHPEFWMNKEEKKRFLDNIIYLRTKFPREFRIETNDPLFCLVRERSEGGGDGEIIFDGCSAGSMTFNVKADGNMTPCALLDVPMMNVFPLSIEEMTASYKNNELVHNMLDMNLSGKCGKCQLKYQCGGCRARAYTRNGGYLAEDPDCWI